MHDIEQKDIITALATPYGRSAIAVIRVSGKGSLEFIRNFLTRDIVCGKITVNRFVCGEFAENLMTAGFKTPKTYTGEDLVELYPHGNPLICDKIIACLLGGGARLAQKGEFTKRAFLNGKMDLMQCEALADIIDAQTAEGLRYGNARYNGAFNGLKEAEKLLNKALSSVEAVLHYGDELEGEEIDEAIINDVYAAVDIVAEKLEKEIKAFNGGRIANDGFRVALIGEPNVGKSTLLNALTDSDRAIVTPIAGTTRDVIEHGYIYKDRKFTVTDTAGLKESTADEVERIGMERSRKAASEADAVILVSTSESASVEVEGKGSTVEVINKCDNVAEAGTDYERAEKNGKLEISAKNGINITALKQKLYDICPREYGEICNYRQYACVLRALDCCEQAKKERKTNGGLEIVAALLYDAYSAMVELYGGQADEKIINSVFERFCVGK